MGSNRNHLNHDYLHNGYSSEYGNDHSSIIANQDSNSIHDESSNPLELNSFKKKFFDILFKSINF